jgi:quercetin dioxygenase-like cupin family protein
MGLHALRLSEDRLRAGETRALPATPRVLYVHAGATALASEGRGAALRAGGVWHGSGACRVTAGGAGATVLRWELVRGGAPPAGGRLVLEQRLDLDPRQAYLVRCDRVEFGPGDVALPHRHRGGGIRYLLEGELAVTVGDRPPRRMTPGSAWFESGREPVLAVAATRGPTAFLRVAVLPRTIRGQSSIMYVDPAAAARGRPRHYTVHVDAPIRLP